MWLYLDPLFVCKSLAMHSFDYLLTVSHSFIARVVESTQVYSEYPGVKVSSNDDIEVSKKENHNYTANEKWKQRYITCKGGLFRN